ncbi:MAG: hypothetical protein N4A74_16720 [Carboxylicivirga sp.]|jgi:hypothetical protein|nr:hypothetical protein [Carboxylicivirga sp.]
MNIQKVLNIILSLALVLLLIKINTYSSSDLSSKQSDAIVYQYSEEEHWQPFATLPHTYNCCGHNGK